ncbi:MAG: hypothetical protein GC201_09075 [Alphaproteobacteria bacterium]|nr:hypothetical protein [Alphaproteobacteria bacterium]
MSARRGSFESLVSAPTAQAAVEIAGEGLPKGAELVDSTAEDVSGEHGPNSWLVTIRFRRAAPEGDY